MKSYLLPLSILVLILCGCASKLTVTHTVHVSGLKPVRSGQPTRIYEMLLPSCPYQEIATVEGKISYSEKWKPERAEKYRLKLRNKLKARARRLGGHALIGLRELAENQNQPHVDSRDKIEPPIDSKTGEIELSPVLVIRATVIRFMDSDCLE